MPAKRNQGLTPASQALLQSLLLHHPLPFMSCPTGLGAESSRGSHACQHVLTKAVIIPTFCGLPIEAILNISREGHASSECLGPLTVEESRDHPVIALQTSLTLSLGHHLVPALFA